LTNETFLRNALKINSFILKYCTNALRDDYDAVKSIISIEACGGELEYASKRLLEKKDLVLLAYQNAGDFTSIYEKLSAALKRDVEVIEAAKKARDCHFSLA